MKNPPFHGGIIIYFVILSMLFKNGLIKIITAKIIAICIAQAGRRIINQL